MPSNTLQFLISPDTGNTHTGTHTSTKTHTHTHTGTHASKDSLSHTHKQTNAHTHTQTKRRTDTGTHTSTHSLSHTQTNKHTQLKRKFLQISRSQVYPWPDVLFIAEELGINKILDCIHALVTPETEKNTNP